MSSNTSLDVFFMNYKMAKNDRFISNCFPVVHQQGIHIHRHTPSIAISKHGKLRIRLKIKEYFKDVNLIYLLEYIVINCGDIKNVEKS